MNRNVAAALAILAVVTGVGWKLANHPGNSAGLKDVRLIQRSEHSHAGPTGALAGIRIRLSPSDFDDRLLATAHGVPQIALAPE